MNRFPNVLYTHMVLLAALAMTMPPAVADTVDADHRVQWLTTVTEGYYDDPANWEGNELPKDGKNGKYGYINFQTSDVTLKAPPEGLVENSGTIFLGTGSGTHTLTIDTRGTFWEKRGLVAAEHWWGTPFAQNLSGSHIFNFEGCDSGENETLVWRFTDALFTWKSTGTTRQDFDLHSGTFTFNKSLYLGSTTSPVNFTIHPEARIDGLSSLQQRGNGATHMTFLGGGPHSFEDITLKDANSSGGRTWLHVTNDAVVVSRGPVNLGSRTAGNSAGIIDVSQTARFEVTNSIYLGAGSADVLNIRNQGELEIRDHGSCYVFDRVCLGNSQCSTGRVTVLDQGRLTSGGSFFFGSSSNAVGYLEARDDAVIVCGGVFYQARAKESKAYTMLRDRATLSISPAAGNWLCLSPHEDDAYARFEATDDAVVKFSNASSLEMTMGGTSRAEFILSGRAKLLGGSTSYVTNKSVNAGNTSISLSSEAFMSTCAVYGGSPVDGSPAMAFSADGGTLAVSGTPRVPFMSGCVATLGAGGLTFDTTGYAVTFDQAFTAAEGAPAATFTKMGMDKLTVRRDSEHPKTLLKEGCLAFASGAKRFGKELVVEPGAYLAVADTSSAINVDTLTFTGSLAIDLPTDYTLNEAHPVLSVATSLTAEQFAQIVVLNPEAGKAYQFTRSEDGTSVGVTVTAAATGAYAWNAASGNWNDSANWSPEGVPSHNDTVTVASGAAIAMDGAGSVGTMAVQATDAVTVSGDAALYVAEGVSVVEGGSLAVSVPVRNADGLQKEGAGTLALSGGQPRGMSGDWLLYGGVTEFKTAASLGANSSRTSALTISNCTFRYSGEATEMMRPLRIAGEYCSVLDIAGDLTLDNVKVSYANTKDGGIVKTGAGTLTLNVPRGVTELTKPSSASERGSNKHPSGTFKPENGEVKNWDGAGQFTVLDGRVVIKGQGKDVSTVNQKYHGTLGGSGWKSTVAPELYLKDVTCKLGSGGFHFRMDVDHAKDAPAAKLVLDNADVAANGVFLGVSGTGADSRPVLAITNGTLDVEWQFQAPAASGYLPIVRIGEGGCLRRKNATVAGGVEFNYNLDVRVEDGGCVEVAAPQNLYLKSGAVGDFILANGGGLKVNQLFAQNTGTAAYAFDGGYVQFTLDGGFSTASTPEKTSLRADAGGCELRVDADVSHSLAFPLRGAGMFTKTGAGTLVMTNDTKVAFQTVYDPNARFIITYTPLTSQHVKIENDGGVRIDAGTLRCVAGTTGEKSRFSGTGTLSGTFDVVRLDVADDATDGLTLADLTATQVVADFHHAAEEPVTTGDSAVVAKLGDGMSFGNLAWRAVNLGDGKVAQFSCDAAGVVTATFRSTGMTIFIR